MLHRTERRLYNQTSNIRKYNPSPKGLGGTQVGGKQNGTKIIKVEIILTSELTQQTFSPVAVNRCGFADWLLHRHSVFLTAATAAGKRG